MYTLVKIARLNDVDSQAWVADILRGIADTTQTHLATSLPRSWKVGSVKLAACAPPNFASPARPGNEWLGQLGAAECVPAITERTA
jgi:hypothetical protein